MIDTHCHLTFDPLSLDVEGVLGRARAAGVDAMISVSVTPENCVVTQPIAEAYPEVWFSAGHHPLYAHEPRDWSLLRAAASHPRCVAWGELGLDNHYPDPPRSQQDSLLQEALAMIESAAGEGVRKPIIIHCREAFDDVLAVLRASTLPRDRLVFHCFTGGPDDARKVLDFGAWISFTGVVTFRNAREVAAAAKLVPADRIMVETDAPFLTPEPHRKVWPNEPQYVVYVARALADMRGEPREAFEHQLDANVARFFGIRNETADERG